MSEYLNAIEIKLDQVITKLGKLESHIVNDICMKQDIPSINNLVIQLNDYTRHVKQMHSEACQAYGKMNELAANFRKECEPYGEIRFLNKKLHEIMEILKSSQKPREEKKLSWIEELEVELDKTKAVRAPVMQEDKEYRDYERRALSIMTHLESLEKQMLLFRCQPTNTGHMITYKVLSKHFNTPYNEARELCRLATRKLLKTDVAKLNDYNLCMQYGGVTGNWTYRAPK